MRTEYHKLVRDYIPDIIRRHGDECAVEIMNEEEYRQALRIKLLEEAQEFSEANRQDMITELADIYEVIGALMRVYGLTVEEVKAEQERRRSERGGFEQRVRLVWTE